MTRHHNMFAVAASCIFIACAADAAAQTKTVAKSASRSVGNRYLGLTGYAYGFMKSYTADPSQMIYTGRGMTLSSAKARGYLRATATILGSRRELGRFDARGDAYSTTTGASVRGSYRLVLAGKTMVSKSFKATTRFPRFAKYISLFPVDPRADIPVGPFSLRIKGNAGVGIESSGLAMLATSPSVGLFATTKAWGQGKASVAFGVLGFRVGAQAIAKLAEQTLGTSLWATKSNIHGSVQYTMVALRLKLRAYASAFWGAASYSRTVLDRSYGALTRTLFKL